MIRSYYKLIFVFLLLCNISYAQDNRKVDSLRNLCRIAQSDSTKVQALKNLAYYYFANNLINQGDSVFQEQLLTAELSGNENLMYATLFDNSLTNLSAWSKKENVEKGIQLTRRGIDFAKSKNSANYIAIGYCNMANLLLKKGDPRKALENAYIALSYIQNIESDSIKAIVYIQLGDCYKNSNDAVYAFTNYNNAYDISLKIENYFLLTRIYHKYFDLYSTTLDDSANAMEALKKSLALNKERNNAEGILKDYFDMASRTDNQLYIIKGLALADSLHLDKWTLKFKIIMLSYKMVVLKNAEDAINYLDKETDLRENYSSSGIAYYYWMKGEIYKYGGKFDSALHYLKLGEAFLLNNFNTFTAQGTYFEIAEAYALNNEKQNAINYYEKALALSKELSDLKSIATISARLSTLYEETGNYKKSLSYSKQSILYKDTLQEKTRERDIALLGVESERKKHEADLAAEQLKAERTINLQYMAITVVISVVFVFILFLGFFPVSKFTIKMLGYFFFISVFEFIVMLIDNNILWKFTHGQPLKLWLIKIGLIACLVPLQHLLEHRMIKFLESRKLLEAKKRFSIMRIWKRKQKPAPVLSEAGIEEIEADTAVL